MKKQIFLAIAAIFALSASFAYAQECNNNTPYVEVRGSASMAVEPNKIEVNITISQADSKGKTTLAELESQLAAALKKVGINDSKQLVITSQSSDAAKRNNIYQFKSYTLTVSSAQELANVFEAFAQYGVANAYVGRMWNDKQSQYEAQVKAQAMQNAQKSATVLSESIGQSIGKAIMIQDFSSSPSPMDNGGLMMSRSSFAKSDGATLSDDVAMRKINIVQSVTVRFALN